MPTVFLNYRHSDSAGWAGHLDDSLKRLLPPSVKIVRDVYIPPGVDFERYIDDAVAKCDLMIALIGPQWLDARDSEGNARFDAPNDWTRVEIEAALRRDIRVIPVLVGGARLPAPTAIPKSLRSLLKRQTFELADRGWDEDCRRLSQALQEAIPELPRAWSFAPSRRVILTAVVAITVLAGAAKFWRSIADLVSTTSAKHEEKPTSDPAKPVAGPSGSPAPGSSPNAASASAAAPTLLDLGLEGTWRIDRETGPPQQIQVVRTGSSLTLRDPRGGEGDSIVATVIRDTVNLQFGKGPSITATPQTPGKLVWIFRVENLSGCSTDGSMAEASSDLRHWKVRWVCKRATSDVVDFTADLATDSSALIVTATQQGSRTDTIVLHHEQ